MVSNTQPYCRQNYFFWFVFGVAIFIAFFVLFNVSLADEEPIYDKEKAIEIAKSQGGPGGCKSEAECNAFCSDPDSAEVCLSWAKENGVIKDGQFEKDLELIASGGPGGCKTAEDCRAYCDDLSHSEECTDFAEKQGFISKEDAQRARKRGPGDCRTQKDCRAFCEQPQNQDTCLDYAVRDGLMSQEELDRIREFRGKAEEFRKRTEKFARQKEQEFRPPEVEEIDPGFDEKRAKELIETQTGPGGCKTFEECRAFCDNPNNQEACFTCAEEHGLFKNREEANKIRGIIKEGGPGGCHGEKACREFCSNPDNAEVCLEFGQKHGLISPQDIERAKKGMEAFKEGGPAGCKTRESCEKVCQDPANQEACFEWAKKHGLISEEELKFIEESKKMREKFEHRQQEMGGEFRSPEGFGPPEGFRSPGEFLGPGGCKGAEECRKYCSDPAHSVECQSFRTPSGVQPPGFGGQPPGSPHPGEFTPPQFTRPPSGENGIVCTQEFNPVCGTDRRTYPNPCFAGVAGVGIAHSGKCEGEFTPPPELTRPLEFTKLPEFSVPPLEPDPATDCAKRGGSWSGTYCKFESFPSPYPSPSPSPETSPTSLLSRAFSLLLNSLEGFFR